MNDNAIEIKNVSKYYRLYDKSSDRLKEALHPGGKRFHKKFYALNNINLTVKRGEIVGIIGSNGSGKSTLLKIIANVLTPNSGNITVNGNVSALLELGASFNPDFTGMENLFFYATILGIPRKTIDEKLQNILEFADIGDFIHQPLKTYSSGMKARLGFAIATEIDPDILIIDEVLAVGDATFQRKCYARIEGFMKKGKTIFIVSHNRNSIVSLCSHVVFLDGGKISMQGQPEEVMSAYENFINRKYLKQDMAHNAQKSANQPETKAQTTSRQMFDHTLTSTPVPFLSSRIDLVTFSIIDKDNHRVNILETGERYTINIVFRFEEDIDEYTLALRIKTIKGVVASWFGYPAERGSYTTAKTGEIKSYKISFDCNLLDGIYSIDFGIQSLRDDDIHIHIGYNDFYLFKINKKKYTYHGISYLNFNCLEHTQ